MRFLLLGGGGQVGREFQELKVPVGVEVVAPGRRDADLSDASSIAGLIAKGPWSCVINAAAYTEVDRAETERDVAFAVNAEGPKTLAVETVRYGIPLIHISTDYVFDGNKGSPYIEQDKTAPLNVYGASKLEGEYAVRAGNPSHIILRTSWVYSQHRKNFVKTILRLAKERESLSIVNDQRGCPTAASDIAAACRDVALRCAAEPAKVSYGVYHFAGEGETNWFEFAKTILEMASNRIVPAPRVSPISTVDYPTPAVRPKDTRLDCAAVVRSFGVKPRPWREALEETINQLLP